MNNPQVSTTLTNPARQKEDAKTAPQPPPRASHKKHHVFLVVLILLVIAVGIGALLYFGRAKPRQMVQPPVAITVVNVRKGDIAVSVPNIGSVTPVYTASISARVDGQLLGVYYTEGQMVRSNDLLAVIDPGPYQAALLQAEGQLERDTNLLAGAYVDLQRYQAAYAKNAIAKQQVDDQTALMHQDEGTVRFDEGQVAAARVNLGYCYIRAPFDGQAGLRLVDPGNVIHAANTNAIVVIAQLQPITVLFNVAEDYLPQIQDALREDPEMVVEAWDRDEQHKIATGRVLALNNQIDPATGTLRIRAIFDNEDLKLFPNQFVNAKLIIKVLHDQVLIPTDAIQHNPEGAFVYLVTNHPPANTNHTASAGGGGGWSHGGAGGESKPAATASGGSQGAGTNLAWVTMRNIIVGPTDGDTSAVMKGLQVGEQLAFDNFNKLGEGVKVSLHPQGTPAGGQAGRHHGGSYGKSTEDSPSENKSNQ